MEIGAVEIGTILTVLVTCIATLWKVIDNSVKRERERHDSTENELKLVRGQQIELLTEVAELRGQLGGQKVMSERVLKCIAELKNNDVKTG